MKIKDGYMLREVANTYVAVPIGKAALDFSGVVTLNGTGTFLWKMLSKEKTEQELLDLLLEEYEIDAASAKKDLSEFLSKLKAADLLE